jgi:hypothetical protein
MVQPVAIFPLHKVDHTVVSGEHQDNPLGFVTWFSKQKRLPDSAAGV